MTGAISRVVAAGVTINSNASFFAYDPIPAKLPTGTVLTAIENTSANPIAGTFSNLADGSTFILRFNTLKVDYQGGDGNDLTLTVQ
jgi:hypothetical protein